MNINNLFSIYCLLILSVFGCSKKEDAKSKPETFKIEVGTGSFNYTDYAPLSSKPIKVWYYKPAVENAKILIVLHGSGREGESYRDAMKKYAEKYNCMLIVPEFSEELYNSRLYHEGGVVTSKGVLRNAADWTLSVIEPLFEYTKKYAGNNTNSYYIFGFSAGCQFVHRFMTFVPDNNAEKIIAASAGGFTLPDYSQAYPYGLLGLTSVVPSNNFKKIYAKETYIIVGDKDNDAKASNLPNDPEDIAQGKHRVERTKNYFTKSQTYAGVLQTPFNWTYKEIPNAAHNFSQLIEPASKLLFEPK